MNFFYRLPQNLAKVFWGKNLPWHALAIVLTFLCVTSGLDWKYHQATQISGLQPWLFPAVILGMFLPVIVPLLLLAWGAAKHNQRALNTAYALGQAAFLGWFVSAFYKTFTGRPGPEHINMVGDISHVFKFGFLRGGVFWGWPSSHTTVALAMTMTLAALYPKNKVITWLAIIYALYITLSVSMTIHWFSDCVAGVIFGSLVGVAVGKSFIPKLNAAK